MSEGILEDIDNFISSIPNSQESIKEFNTRCPICGDSAKDPKVKRLYISKLPPFKYYCHNCMCCGVLNRPLIRGLVDNIDKSSVDSSTILDCEDKANKLITKLYKFKKDNAFNYTVPLTNDSISNLFIDSSSDLMTNSIDELHYLTDRYGFEFNDDLIQKYRIILNPINFFNKNKLVFKYLLQGINKESIRKNIKLLMDLIKQGHKFIGFIPDDNSRVLFRTIGDCRFRYININLLTKVSVYMLKKDDISFNDNIKVSITEGVFDCISAFHNFDYDISIATMNSNYVLGIHKLITLGVYYKNVEIHIIADNDTTGRRSIKSRKLNDMKKLFNIKSYINLKGKDIGVRKDQIELVELI